MQFPTRVEVKKKATTPDTEGGRTTTLTSLTGEDQYQQVRIRPANSGEREVGARLEMNVEFVVYTRKGTPIRRGMELHSPAISQPLKVLKVSTPSRADYSVLECERTEIAVTAD